MGNGLGPPGVQPLLPLGAVHVPLTIVLGARQFSQVGKSFAPFAQVVVQVGGMPPLAQPHEPFGNVDIGAAQLLLLVLLDLELLLPPLLLPLLLLGMPTEQVAIPFTTTGYAGGVQLGLV